MQRLVPTRPLPPYAFIPGRNPHPLKKDGHMEISGEPESTPLTNDNYHKHEDYLFAIDLFNNGFYWETHAYLEAIWNANKRQGDEAKLCLIIIKMAAAQIKKIMGQENAYQTHIHRAMELQGQVKNEKLCGLTLPDLDIESIEINIDV